MTVDDISHAAHVGHLQGRIGELEAKLREAEGRAAKAERERDVREANLSTALWDLDRARTALGGLGHPSGDVALGIGVLKELYEKCGRYLDEARRERDEARRRLREHSVAFHARSHGGLWMDCSNRSCLTDRAALGEKP